MRELVAAGYGQWRLYSSTCFEESEHKRIWGLTVIIFLLMLTIIFFPGSVRAEEGESKAEQVFATVNGESIHMSTYRSILHLGARQRFYHGQPPVEELKAYRKEVGEQLVEEMVLHQEAVRRGIEANSERVKHEMEKNIKRLQTQTGWQEAKNNMLPMLQQGLARHDRIRQLQDQFRSEVSLPDETELKTFYQANLDKFTSPPQTRISMILLKVPPWGGADQWRAKRDELTQIKHKITKGMEFSEAAKRYSNDGSASSGGDMGYLHQGMLGSQAEQAISELAIDDISDPITLLEGVALFQLIERSDARINPLQQVRQRAVDLLMRERRESVVSERKRRLRNKADIQYLVPDYYEQRQEVRGRSNKNKS
ncbi:MAG: peptidylprolyl isomerase [Candidatus Thiodiazotropha lotti]|nr:peptidylprolyl isomerase [Candidatus Thiodiazotropha weberae]MCG7982956.1 peptidylprolyl isomerase [Candidatus Thiodiazotropha lotti]